MHHKFQIAGAGRTGIHRSGYPVGKIVKIRIQSDVRSAITKMGMEINQSRENIFS